MSNTVVVPNKGNEIPVMTTSNTKAPISQETIQEVLKMQSEGKIRQKGPVFSTDYEGTLVDEIEAIPLQSTSVENVKLKNPDLMARWVHGESEGRGVGVNFWEGKGIGMRLATADDVEVGGLTIKDGHYKWGGMILMVCPKRNYNALLKEKDKRSHEVLTPSARLARGKSELSAAISGPATGDRLDPALSGKGVSRAKEILSTYIPGGEEQKNASI